MNLDTMQVAVTCNYLKCMNKKYDFETPKAIYDM